MLVDLKILPFVLLSLLYSQWAMWANPSLPVGNSDQGVGIAPGEIMIFGDYSYQNFDWWHDIVPGAIIPGTDEEENFANSLCVCALCKYLNTIEEKWKTWKIDKTIAQMVVGTTQERRASKFLI